ncbi:hypothetical protein [Ralstonia phage RP13]|nr:hypothetical protein [Ralstonia phage RP13]
MMVRKFDRTLKFAEKRARYLEAHLDKLNVDEADIVLLHRELLRTKEELSKVHPRFRSSDPPTHPTWSLPVTTTAHTLQTL